VQKEFDGGDNVSYVYMKVLESAPERYDRGMRLLTLGCLERVHQDIAARLKPGDRVLDVGCGTGALAILLARKGTQVTGIDISPSMLYVAARRLEEQGLDSQVTLCEMGAVALDSAFADGSFDAVVSTLLFSELSDDEIEYTLTEIRRILRPGGQLFIADEILPTSLLGRVATFVLRLPFATLAFALTQTTTRRVAGLGERIEGAGFTLSGGERYLAGTLQLFSAERKASDV
jgi:demethylmenaquinone methyltransferase/2-methoxy-6-polyprenyl-1,4-benzoquinol methylase